MIQTQAHAYIAWLMKMGLGESWAVFIKTVSLLIILIFLSIAINWIAKFLIVLIEKFILRRSRVIWDDFFLEKKVFHRLSHLAPALLIYLSNYTVFGEYNWLCVFVEKASYIYMLLAVTLALEAMINALHASYNTLPISRTRPIKGYIQGVKIFVFVTMSLLVISVVFRIDMKGIFTALGALTAVLILVFKDTILGFVASIQIAANEMVKPGDWIELPARGVDGTVMDISVNTVKVQNFDKTILTIPTYAMVSETFQNWKGMEESGGRRIKRHINIDMKTVRFCTPEMIEKFKKIELIRELVEKKEKEFNEYSRKHGIDYTVIANGYRMTNLGIFRAYVTSYLKNHPRIHPDMTFLVRHRQPTEFGLPLELYVFSRDQQWADYENLQADIFDHLLAVINEFDLRVYQHPTGEDFRKIVH